MINLPKIINRLRRVEAGELHREVYGYSSTPYSDHYLDRKEFPIAMLDRTPIDEAWLVSLGFYPQMSGAWWYDLNDRKILSEFEGRWYLSDDANEYETTERYISIPSITTRGQLTSLLFSLGVFDE